MQFGVVPSHGPKYVKEMIQQVELCEEYGFNSVWVEEHHSDGPYWPTPFIALGIIAPYTKNLILGTNILILPLYDPVHVAEQLAVLDIISDGKIIFGTSIGDSRKEFDLFRVQPKGRGQRFEEQISVIRKLWTGKNVNFNGKYFQYENINLSVKPKQQGGPPIWIGGWGPLQLKRAASLGDAWFPGPVSDISGIISRQEEYQKMILDLGGNTVNRDHPLTRDVVIAETNDKAWKMAETELLPAYVRDYLDSDHPLVGKDSGVDYKGLRELAIDRFIIGDPDTVIAEIRRIIELTHTNHFIFRLKLPGINPDQITEMIKITGQVILPSVQDM